MGTAQIRKQARMKRKKRIRTKISGTAQRPRLCVFRSAKHMYAQVIDDSTGSVLAAASSLEKAVKEQPKFDSKVAMATHIGKLVGQRALEHNIQQVVFDRNGFLYHGRVKALSEGAREAGLKF